MMHTMGVPMRSRSRAIDVRLVKKPRSAGHGLFISASDYAATAEMRRMTGEELDIYFSPSQVRIKPCAVFR